MFPWDLIEILFVNSVLGGVEPGSWCVWQTEHVDNVLESVILSILRFLSHSNTVSPERMEAVAVRWHSSFHPIPLADDFSREVGRR